MIDTPDFIERRQTTRYTIVNGIVALPRSITVAIGTIVNISNGGIAIRYTTGVEQNGSSDTIDILLTDHNFYITGSPVYTIADFQLENNVPFSYIYERHCSMQFHDLTELHRKQLNGLLSNYIAGTG
jgi:c-di-GMP-binding flagellar brake protein YcgR